MKPNELIALALVQHHEHAIILLDTNARVVGWYPGATKMFGYSAEEMIGETLARIFTPEDLIRGDLDWEIRAAREYGKSEDDRWQVRKDGLRIWVAGIVTALRSAEGEPVGFVKVLRDRTDIRAHIEALQNRLDQATRLEDDRHLLVGTLAHELRNPLGPLRNAAEMIRIAAGEQPRVKSCVSIIDRQIDFIQKLLNDLLEATRVGVGKAKLHCGPCDLRGIIDAALETCSAFLDDRRQKVEVIIPDRLSFECDGTRMQQVLVNLISNSSKFSPPGTTIYIKATVDGDAMVLRVEDHGRGIPSDVLPHVFELFTQADGEGEGSSRGLGLGLGLVKSIVEMHGGTVQARSEGAGQGAEMIINLPLKPRVYVKRD